MRGERFGWKAFGRGAAPRGRDAALTGHDSHLALGAEGGTDDFFQGGYAMRILAIRCAFGAILAAMATPASAGDKAASVSQETLRSMGLGAARLLSDEEGNAVRGKGHFAIVSGSATAGGTTKSYLHIAPPGNSVSGFKIVFSGGTFAGGGASASAH